MTDDVFTALYTEMVARGVAYTVVEPDGESGVKVTVIPHEDYEGEA